MNERILLLERQAIIGALRGNDPDGDVDQMYISAEFTKKFAELLLFECIKIAVFKGDATTGKAIKQHFGVEE